MELNKETDKNTINCGQQKAVFKTNHKTSLFCLLWALFQVWRISLCRRRLLLSVVLCNILGVRDEVSVAAVGPVVVAGDEDEGEGAEAEEEGEPEALCPDGPLLFLLRRGARRGDRDGDRGGRGGGRVLLVHGESVKLGVEWD